MKTVASCPSDRSCGAGTGTAPRRELRGDGETNKDGEKQQGKNREKKNVRKETNRKCKNRAGRRKREVGGSFDTNVVCNSF